MDDLSFDDLIPADQLDFEDLVPRAPAQPPAAPRRGGTRAEARPYVAGGTTAEGDPRQFGVEPSRVQGGRGTVVERPDERAVYARGQQPLRDKREAIDQAVDLIESGAQPERVFQEFGSLGVTPQEIQARGRELGGRISTAGPGDMRPGVPGAPAGEMRPFEPSALQEVANVGRRGAEAAGGMVDALSFQAGAMGAPDLAERTRERQRRIAAAAPSGDVAAGIERLAQANESGSWGDVASALVDPANFKGLAAIIGESVIASSPGVAATLGGFALAGPAGGAAAAGVSSFAMEYGFALGDVLEKRGVDTSDPVALRRALEDREVLDEASQRGLKRGIPIGVMDALSAGVAGRLVRSVERGIEAGRIGSRRATGALAAATAAELGIQSGASMAGELGAQIATGESSPLDVLVEGIAELPGGVGEVVAGASSARSRTPEAQIAAELDGVRLRGIRQDAPGPAQDYGALMRAKGFTSQLAAPRAPRVEEMPTRPLQPEEIAAIVPARPPEVPLSAPGAAEGERVGAPVADASREPFADESVAGSEGLPTGEVTELGVPQAGALGVAAVPQGSLADRADQLLRERARVDQPDVAGAPGVVADAPVGGGDQSGGGVGDLGPDAPQRGGVGERAEAPPAGGGQTEPLADVGKSDPALNVEGGVDPFKSAGQALAYAAQNRLSQRVRVVPAPTGKGFVLEPIDRPPTPEQAAEDQRELDALNAALRTSGTFPGGAPSVRQVPDAATPALFRRVQRVVDAAFGIRVIPVQGLPGEGIQAGRRAYVDAKVFGRADYVVGVTGHEAFHWLERNDPAAHARLVKAFGKSVKISTIKRRVAAEQAAADAAGERVKVSQADAAEEVFADINGSLWVDPDFWSRMYELDNGSTFRKVLYQFMRGAAKLVRVAAGSRFDVSRYVTDVQAVREVAAQVWAERAQAPRTQRADAAAGVGPRAQQARQPDQQRTTGWVKPALRQARKDGWSLFPQGSGTLGIPRANMPQVRTSDRPAMLEFLAERGIGNQRLMMPAAGLKPTQAEFSKPKVDGAMTAPDDGSMKNTVLVSSDGYVLDGHHRWMARAQQGKQIDAIRLGAPIRQLLDTIWQFPRVGVDEESEGAPPARRALPAAYVEKIDAAASAASLLLPQQAVDDVRAMLERFPPPDGVDVPAADRARLDKIFSPLIKQAAEVNPAFTATMNEIAEKIDARAVVAPPKSLKRSVEKMYQDEVTEGRKAEPGWLKDSVRGTIVVKREADVYDAIAAIGEAFDVQKIKNRFAQPMPTGYRDVMIQAKTKDAGFPVEIQVNLPPMLAAKDLGHLLYEVERAMPYGADRARLTQSQRRLYGLAYDLSSESLGLASSASNSSSDTTPPSRMTRPTTTGVPLRAENADSPLGASTTGMPSRSTSVEPGARAAFQSNATADSLATDYEGILPRQARRLKPGERSGTPDPKILRDISERLGLTPEEAASTSLEWQTGLPKDKAFSVPAVGPLKVAIEFLENRRRASGLRTLNIENEQDRATLARLMAAETLAAIRGAGNALEWYDSTIRRTLAMAAVKYPELNRDQGSRNAFLVAMAITSQGLNVENNLGLAMRQYEAWRSSSSDPRKRKFPIVGEGESATQMVMNFELVNDLLEDLGPGLLERFLRTPFTVGELKAAGFEAEGELIDEMVMGSSVLGPKIGFGFYSNLSGNFEPVTMDMWFMRTIGRLTGFLRAFEPAKFQKQSDRFRAAFDVRIPNGITAAEFDAELVEAARADNDKMVELARRVVKAHERDYKANRAQFDDGTRVKSELVNAAATILQSLDKPRDAPASGGERRLLRDVVRRTVDIVEQVHGQRIPPAALQALIWYPEQELYKALGVSLNVTSQDYAGATEKVLVAEGFDEKKLRAAAKSGSRGARPANGRDVARGAQAADQEPGRLGPLEADERAAFLEQRTYAEALRRERLNPRRTRVNFEVAPDPRNAELSARWSALPGEAKARISEKVMRAIVPRILEANDNSGLFVSQVGSWMDDTNPSFAVLLDKFGNALDVAKEIGFVLSQEGMALFSPKSFNGSFESGAVVVDVGNATEAEVAELYQRLRQIPLPGGEQISGQSTANGQMTILVPAAFADDWGRKVDSELGGAYTVRSHVVHAAFPSSEEYDYGLPQSDPRGNRGLARQRARALRDEASQLLSQELDAAERAPGFRQSRAAGPAEPAVRSGSGGGEGDAAEPGVVRGAVHYGRLPGLSRLSGRAYGTGLRGAERARLDEAEDQRIKRRVYFYVPKTDGAMPLREAGVGPFRYEADLSNLADFELSREHAARVNAARRGQGPNAFESAVLDAGFDGYISRANGMAVVLNRDVDVRQAAEPDRPATAPAPAAATTVRRALLSREAAELEPRMAELQRIAPSARLRMGTLTFSSDEQAAVDAFLSGEYAASADPFADNYSRLEGRQVRQQVLIQDTGQTATLTFDAAQYLRELDQRLDAARRLADCVAGAR